MSNVTCTHPWRCAALSSLVCLVVFGFSGCGLFQSEPDDLSVEGIGALAARAPDKLNDTDLARVVQATVRQRAVNEADARRLAAIYAAHVGRFATAFHALRSDDAPAAVTAAQAESYMRVTAQHRSAHDVVRRATQSEIGRRLAAAARVSEFPPRALTLATSTAGFARAVARALVPQASDSDPIGVDGTINSLYYGSIATLRGKAVADQRSDPTEQSAARTFGAKHVAFFVCVMVAQRRAREGDTRTAEFISALRQYDALAGDAEKILAPGGLPLAPSTLKERHRSSLDSATDGLPTLPAGDERFEDQQAAAYRIAKVTVPLLSEFSSHVDN